MVSSTSRPQFNPGKDPVPILQEAGWAPGPVWTGGKISSPPRLTLYIRVVIVVRKFPLRFREPGKVIGVVTRLRNGRMRKHRLGEISVSSLELSDQLWCSTRALSNAYRGSFPGLRRPWLEVERFIPIYCRS